MKIYEFLRKVTEIELSQVKYVFGDWDLALEEYVNKCERHRAPNVMALLKLSFTLGELVDLYRGLELKRYPIPEAELEAKKQRYDTLMEYCLRGNGGHLSMFERITNGSRMEQRLNFIYEMQLMLYKVKMLAEGNSFVTSEKGNSMTPLIKSGQKHVLSPVTLDKVEVGDIVFCKVKGRYYTHLVRAKGDRGVLIGNNHGKINGWTKSVFGKVTKIL